MLILLFITINPILWAKISNDFDIISRNSNRSFQSADVEQDLIEECRKYWLFAQLGYNYDQVEIVSDVGTSFQLNVKSTLLSREECCQRFPSYFKCSELEERDIHNEEENPVTDSTEKMPSKIKDSMQEPTSPVEEMNDGPQNNNNSDPNIPTISPPPPSLNVEQEIIKKINEFKNNLIQMGFDYSQFEQDLKVLRGEDNGPEFDRKLAYSIESNIDTRIRHLEDTTTRIKKLVTELTAYRMRLNELQANLHQQTVENIKNLSAAITLSDGSKQVKSSIIGQTGDIVSLHQRKNKRALSAIQGSRKDVEADINENLVERQQDDLSNGIQHQIDVTVHLPLNF